MLYRERISHRPVRAGADPLGPETKMSISRGSEIERLAVRRPVGPILGRFFGDLDSGAFGYRFGPIERCDHNPGAIRLYSGCKAHPAIVGREAGV